MIRVNKENQEKRDLKEETVDLDLLAQLGHQVLKEKEERQVLLVRSEGMDKWDCEDYLVPLDRLALQARTETREISDHPARRDSRGLRVKLVLWERLVRKEFAVSQELQDLPENEDHLVTWDGKVAKEKMDRMAYLDYREMQDHKDRLEQVAQKEIAETTE